MTEPNNNEEVLDIRSLTLANNGMPMHDKVNHAQYLPVSSTQPNVLCRISTESLFTAHLVPPVRVAEATYRLYNSLNDYASPAYAEDNSGLHICMKVSYRKLCRS